VVSVKLCEVVSQRTWAPLLPHRIEFLIFRRKLVFARPEPA